MSPDRSHPTSNVLLAMASIVVIVAGLKAASSLLVPFLAVGMVVVVRLAAACEP